MDRANRDHGGRGVDRHAAAIQVVETDHAVDIRVFRQQVSFNNFHHIIDDARDAVHAGSDTKQVSGTDAAIGVAIPFKGVAGQRRQRLRNFVCQR